MTYQAALIGGPGDGETITVNRDQPWRYLHRAVVGGDTTNYLLSADEQGTPRTDSQSRIVYHYESA